MISSAARPGDLERCHQLGIARYLLKPVIQSELLEVLLDTIGVAAPVESAEGEPRDWPCLKILLAEDGLINQRVAVGLLEERGHDVILAA